MSLKRNLTFIVCLACLVFPQALFACAVCGGRSDSSLAKGMNMGILALLGVVVFVLSGIATFAIYLVRRSTKVNGRETESPGALQPETQQT